MNMTLTNVETKVSVTMEHVLTHLDPIIATAPLVTMETIAKMTLTNVTIKAYVLATENVLTLMDRTIAIVKKVIMAIIVKLTSTNAKMTVYVLITAPV